MIVYRVEHESIKSEMIDWPCGPFQDDSVMRRLHGEKLSEYLFAIRVLMDHLNANTYRYPTPIADPNLGYIYGDEVCGVDSEESVKDWFGDALPLLKLAGFTVRKYEVPDDCCKIGRSGQVVFQYKHAQKIEEKTDGRIIR